MILRAQAARRDGPRRSAVGRGDYQALQGGDEALRFEDFYDTAISVHEYHKMERQKVLTREELALHLFELI